MVILVRTLDGLYSSKHNNKDKLREVLHFPSGTVDRAKRERPPRLAFLSWGDFYARARFARFTMGLIVV